MHFVGPASGAHVPLSRSEAVRGGSGVQRTACLVLGCVWLGFGLVITLIVIVAALSR